MKYIIEKDKKRRKLVKKYELKRLYLKALTYNQSLDPVNIFHAQLELTKLPKNSSKIRIKNRCVLTGRSRGIYRQFKLSRIKMRDLAAKGLIPGLKKASW